MRYTLLASILLSAIASAASASMVETPDWPRNAVEQQIMGVRLKEIQFERIPFDEAIEGSPRPVDSRLKLTGPS